MNGGTSGSGVSLSSQGPASELTLRTIQEQQILILNLQELVKTLKSQLQSTEEELKQQQRLLQNSRSSDSTAQKKKEEEEKKEWLAKKEALLSSQEQLLKEKEASDKALQQFRKEQLIWNAEREALLREIDGHKAEKAAVEAELWQRTSDWERERRLLLCTEKAGIEGQRECRSLREEVRQLQADRTRWKSLAATLVTRLEPSLQSNLRAHIQSMEREEQRRRQDGRETTAQPTTPALAVPVVLTASDRPEVAAAWRRTGSPTHTANKEGGECGSPLRIRNSTTGPYPNVLKSSDTNNNNNNNNNKGNQNSIQGTPNQSIENHSTHCTSNSGSNNNTMDSSEWLQINSASKNMHLKPLPGKKIHQLK